MKNNKKYILIFAIIIIFIISFFIPIKTEKVWKNDSEIYDVGHYEEYSFNIYGIRIFHKNI